MRNAQDSHLGLTMAARYSVRLRAQVKQVAPLLLGVLCHHRYINLSISDPVAEALATFWRSIDVGKLEEEVLTLSGYPTRPPFLNLTVARLYDDCYFTTEPLTSSAASQLIQLGQRKVGQVLLHAVQNSIQNVPENLYGDVASAIVSYSPRLANAIFPRIPRSSNRRLLMPNAHRCPGSDHFLEPRVLRISSTLFNGKQRIS